MHRLRTATPHLAAAALLAALAALAAAGADDGRAVTDATVAERVGAITRKQDHLDLAAYYRDKAAATVPAIEFQERLLRAYMQLNARTYKALQGEARALLKAARLEKKHYELLAGAHQRMAFEWDE